MCGIAGVININGKPLEWGLCERLSASIAHRGPDDSGEYRYDSEGISAGFVHRRLNIIDLTPAAHQPISNESGKLWLLYNGEIYNYLELRSELVSLGHTFKSHSDSEVVLHAFEEWDEDCLEKFIGMWAFAIWDESSRSLFCSRDRLGVKPFYYSFQPDRQFIFASELRSFLSLDRAQSLDYNALYYFLSLGYGLDDGTWIKGVKKLLPGHSLSLKNGSLRIKQYWDAASFCNLSPDNEDDIKRRLRAILEDSVALRLRSDVAVGAYLSGGIDSTSVVSLISRKSGKPVRIFSGIFEGGQRYDETSFINEVEKAFSLQAKKVLITQKDFMKTMKEVAWQIDEPAAGPGSYSQYHVCGLIKREGYKVVMGGQGGDELFGGYPRYLGGIPLVTFNSYKGFKYDRKSMTRYLGDAGFRLKAGRLRIRRMIRKTLHPHHSYAESRLRNEIIREVSVECKERLGEFPRRIEDMLLWDLKYYLPSLLQVEDRIGMAFSIETRFPLLDHRLVELALSIPFYLKVNSFALKYILRETVKDLLPSKIYERKDKMGFPTPFNEWIHDKELAGNLTEEINPFLTPYFKEPIELTWEHAIIGLWLKRTRVK